MSKDMSGSGRQIRADDKCSSLPCLYSNKCTNKEKSETINGLVSLLSSYHRRQAVSLKLNVERLCNEAVSMGHIGFMTLTFKDNVKDNKIASKRMKSLVTHFLAVDERFQNRIVVKEVQKRGAWHFHILIQLSEDIRDGFDFKEVSRGKYTSANSYLKSLWQDLRNACEKHGFGRSELLPIKSNIEAMSYYVGKYISKNIFQRKEEHKGVRLIAYTKGWSRNSCNFAWNTENAHMWRKKLKKFAEFHGCSELYQLKEVLGSSWAYKYADQIYNIDLIQDEILKNYGTTNLHPEYIDKTVRRLKNKRRTENEQSEE